MSARMPLHIAALLLGAICILPVRAEASAPVVWRTKIEIAHGRGERGPWRQNDSRYDYVDDPAVAIDSRGQIALAWVDQGKKDVFFQRIDDSGKLLLPQPVNVSRSPATFSWLPRVSFAPDDARRVFLIWQEIIFTPGGSHGGEILFARSIDGGVSFSPPLNLSNSKGGDGKGRLTKEVWHNGSFDLAVGRDGTLYAAWTEYGGPLWFSRSSDGGESFSAPQRIAGNQAVPARAPTLAAGPGRTVYLAWTIGETQAAAIRVATSHDGGVTFGPPVMAAPAIAYADAPKLAVDAGGMLHLAYAQSAGGPFDLYRVHYARSADGGRSFEAPREVSSPLPATAQSAAYPMLSIDAENNVYVAWELFPGRRQYSRGLALSYSRDAGKNFAPPVMVPGSSDSAGGVNGSVQGLLMNKLAVNGGGRIAIVNSSLLQDKESRIWLMRAELPQSASKPAGKNEWSARPVAAEKILYGDSSARRVRRKIFSEPARGEYKGLYKGL